MSIDPRLVERRRVVAEDRAKRTVWKLLRFLAVVGVLALAVWFMLSPYMSVSQLEIEGVASSDTSAILASESLVPGRPLILVSTSGIEQALEADPWIADADVSRHWPDRVTVSVVERLPRAWVETADGWTRRAEDGEAVPSPSEPDNTLGWVRLPDLAAGEAAGREEVLGGVDFLMSLPEELARATSLRMEGTEMWGVVDGWQVRLGRPVDMTAKALSLVALLQQGIEPGSVIVLIAPTHPSVDTPGDGTGDEAPEEGEG